MLNFFKNLYNKAVAWCNAPSRRDIIGKATLAVVTLFFCVTGSLRSREWSEWHQ